MTVGAANDERSVCRFSITDRPHGVDSLGRPRPLFLDTLASRIWPLPYALASELRRCGDPFPDAETEIAPGALEPTWTLTVNPEISIAEVEGALAACCGSQWLTYRPI